MTHRERKRKDVKLECFGIMSVSERQFHCRTIDTEPGSKPAMCEHRQCVIISVLYINTHFMSSS